MEQQKQQQQKEKDERQKEQATKSRNKYIITNKEEYTNKQ